jgi:hypothetical protein
MVVGELAAGLNADQVAEEYGLTREDVLATWGDREAARSGSGEDHKLLKHLRVDLQSVDPLTVFARRLTAGDADMLFNDGRILYPNH